MEEPKKESTHSLEYAKERLANSPLLFFTLTAEEATAIQSNYPSASN